MKVLIYCLIFAATLAGVQSVDDNRDCSKVMCPAVMPPDCPVGTEMVRRKTPTPGACCDFWECRPIPIDCTLVKCGRPIPPKCPEDSMLVDGQIPPGQCCPQPSYCVCKPNWCIMRECAPGLYSVLVSKATGKPGKCCDVYECKPVCYTQWFDRDNPGGTGDHELLRELRRAYPRQICPSPLQIQAATLSGISAESIGQVIQTYDTVTGFVCLNAQQKNEECCLDYKVRFGCPCPWPI